MKKHPANIETEMLYGKTQRMGIVMYIDKEKECARLVGELLKAGSKLAAACKDNERATLIWGKRRYLRETSRLLDELIYTLACKYQTCIVCNKGFIPNRADTEYCSNACRQQAYRDRQKDVA